MSAIIEVTHPGTLEVHRFRMVGGTIETQRARSNKWEAYTFEPVLRDMCAWLNEQEAA